MTFYERKATCGICPAHITIEAGDWNEKQAPAVEAWHERHRREAHPDHDGEIPTMVEPNPVFDNL